MCLRDLFPPTILTLSFYRLFNLITVPLAVPVTVLYKIFAGEAPFPLSKVTSSTARIKKDDVRAEATKEVDAVMLLSSLLTVFTGGAEFIMGMLHTPNEETCRLNLFNRFSWAYWQWKSTPENSKVSNFSILPFF